VGQALAENKLLATLPVSLLNLGLALGTIPAALLMRRVGAATGTWWGRPIGVLRAPSRPTASRPPAFVVFCLGTLISGFYGAFIQSYRFAAADSASPAFKARAISWVMAGGLAAGVIGPQVVIWTRDVVPGALFAGAFLGQAVLALLSIVVVSFLRAPPVAEAPPSGGRPPGRDRAPAPIHDRRDGGADLLRPHELRHDRRAACHGGLRPWGRSRCARDLPAYPRHVRAELRHGPAHRPFRQGARHRHRPRSHRHRRVVGLSGISVAHFWISLVVLGVGWNFGFIGATALVTDCYRPEERAKVQAANDFLVFGSVALASFSSGKLLNLGGWDTLNWLVFPPVLLALGLLAWQGRGRAAAV
jgi:hypothetical protein